MSKALNCDPISIANSSGFPLQLRIADVARSSSEWDVLEEHPWSLPEENTKGFIDLILLHQSVALSMVIECKRVKQTAWSFIIPKTRPRERSHARLWASYYEVKWNMFGWSNFQADPPCYESKYCAIPGQSHGSHNLLEKTASMLIDSIEALAFQERELVEKNKSPYLRRIYIPVIVTTAELHIVYFDPSRVSLSEGNLPDDTNRSSVPYVRFRKALTSRLESTSTSSLPEAHQEAERTVFVVNAEKFDNFLNSFEI